MTDKYEEDENNTNKQQQQIDQNKCDSKLLLHYTHEQRLLTIKKDIHHIWTTIFSKTPTTETGLIIDNLNNRNNIKEMVSKRSSKTSYKNRIDDKNI
jgi:hypothetical protein